MKEGKRSCVHIVVILTLVISLLYGCSKNSNYPPKNAGRKVLENIFNGKTFMVSESGIVFYPELYDMVPNVAGWSDDKRFDENFYKLVYFNGVYSERSLGFYSMEFEA